MRVVYKKLRQSELEEIKYPNNFALLTSVEENIILEKKIP